MSALLTEAEVSLQLSLRAEDVRDLVENRLIPFITLPRGEIRFDQEQVTRWYRERSHDATTGDAPCPS